MLPARTATTSARAVPALAGAAPAKPKPLALASGLGTITRVPKSTFRDHIVRALRNAILGGELAPGTPLVETTLATQFDVSRAPLREALRQLIEEGLVVSISYTGTHVTRLSVDDLREVQSMRVMLEGFAFEQAWPLRDLGFRRELRLRHDTLTRAIDLGDDAGSIDAELALHGLVYEASRHQLLQNTWCGLRGRLQLYWAAHHRAHGVRGPRRDSHDSYVAAALGKDLDAMRREIGEHMQRGAKTTEAFLTGSAPPSTPTRAARKAATKPRTTGARP